MKFPFYTVLGDLFWFIQLVLGGTWALACLETFPMILRCGLGREAGGLGADFVLLLSQEPDCRAPLTAP